MTLNIYAITDSHQESRNLSRLLSGIYNFEYKIDKDFIDSIMKNYVMSLPVRFIKTRAELGKDTNNYERNNKNKSDYYSQYYKEFKKIFRK